MVRVVLTVLTLMLVQGQVPSPESWAEAERNIKRLPPSAFANLPKPIIAQLEQRGCTIPQASPELDQRLVRRHNVVHGRFSRPGQVDWAVLCSVGGKTSILVFWGGPSRCPSELALGGDGDYLQGWTEGTIVNSRILDVADQAYIAEHYRRYREDGAPKPPPLNHQGINDVFGGKASVVHYCYRGEWLRLQGMD
jgi:hypothetical protein